MSNLAVIPARGGSKRIPGKNTRDFLGMPIIAYSIQLAHRSKLFSEVIVSTDDEEIKAIAIEYGATVPFMRSRSNSDDFSTLADVIDEVKDNCFKAGKEFKNACCILPTAPLLTEEALRAGYKMLEEENFDSVRPVVRFSYPIQRAFRYNKGKVELMNPEYLSSRSQDLEPAYHDGGQFYWFKYKSGLRGPNRGAIVLNANEIQDIDTEEDWKMAELKYKLFK